MKEKLKVLIAVVTCHRFRERADAQRNTWRPAIQWADVKFFVGNNRTVREDEIGLNVEDDYMSLPSKVRAMFGWAIEQGYDYVFKTDDDVYIDSDKLRNSNFQYDYVGVKSRGKANCPYASGFGYWVSRRSMKLLADAPIDDWAEDRWVGNTLAKYGILCRWDDRYKLIRNIDKENILTGTEPPLPTNDVIAVAELDAAAMLEVYNELSNYELSRYNT